MHFFSAMKEVSTIVQADNWQSCGSTINNKKMKIEISDGLGNKCFTESIMYETIKEGVFVAHDLIVWDTTDLLLNCTEMKIDPVNGLLEGTVIEGEDEIKDCIKFLQVVLTDTDGTVYEKDPVSNVLNKSTTTTPPATTTTSTVTPKIMGSTITTITLATTNTTT